MNLCKVGNQTSSQDPHAVNSRIFVGNLNTFQVNKIDVEKVFQRYGRIVGESSTLIGIMFHQSKKKKQETIPLDLFKASPCTRATPSCSSPARSTPGQPASGRTGGQSVGRS